MPMQLGSVKKTARLVFAVVCGILKYLFLALIVVFQSDLLFGWFKFV